MPLTSGNTPRPYEILSPIGKEGMGEEFVFLLVGLEKDQALEAPGPD